MQFNIPDKDQALKACSVILPPHPTDPVKIRQVATVTRSGAGAIGPDGMWPCVLTDAARHEGRGDDGRDADADGRMG